MRQHQRMAVLALLVGGLLVLSGLSGSTSQAQDVTTRCFPETGQCISDPIKTYWEQNGGLPVFGFPITPLTDEVVEGRLLPVQWFERDRLEDHGANGVLAGRLGAQLLDLQGRAWFDFPQVERAPEGCTYFEQTRHSLCEPFQSYWVINGALDRFGYPITEPFEETIGDWTGTVQYFERRRMEYHTEVEGQPVLLGLLGNEVRAILTGETPPPVAVPPVPVPPVPPVPGASPGSAPDCVYAALEALSPADAAALRTAYDQVPFRVQMGCPVGPVVTTAPALTQQMQNGEMLRLDTTSAPVNPPGIANQLIHAVFQPGPQFRRYNDTWQEGVDAEAPDVTPPAGLHVPKRGFGTVWVNDTQMRGLIGWATEAEPRGFTATVLFFDPFAGTPDTGRSLLVLINETRVVYAFGNGSNPALVRVFQP